MENNPQQPLNRLGNERSPYLRQHANNPVNWWPWCDEAFATAKALDIPIFLSVGYAACHWCHVMEHEAFENHTVAKILNDHYISIKVDREERPDIDEVYMTAVQRMTGHGGWPMSVFMTPDGRPFYGGTYFPVETKGNRIGFISLVKQLAAAWHTRRSEVDDIATRSTDELSQLARQRPLAITGIPPTEQDLLNAAVDDLSERFDSDFGGFGGTPKFPPHHALRLLCTTAATTHPATKRLLEDTLDQIACGGIHDHVGGGFHRYATDQNWFVPHFEKMLYDNAMLARVYAESSVILARESFLTVATRTCDCIIRDFTDPIGGFRSAYDADAEGKEGQYTVWDYDVLVGLAGIPFATMYRAQPKGNWRDEATGHPEPTNILNLGSGIGDVQYPESNALMLETLDTLRQTRDIRIPPLCDQKVLVSWNGLMIGALATVSAIAKRPDLLRAATEAAIAIEQYCIVDGILKHSVIDGYVSQTAGFLDDYAFFIDGLLDLYTVTDNQDWLALAKRLADQMIEHFTDPEEGGFFFTSEGMHERLIVRTKDVFDGALPAANNVAMRVLSRLGGTYSTLANQHMNRFIGVLQRAPSGTATWINAIIVSQLEAYVRIQGQQKVCVTAGDSTVIDVPLQIPNGWHIPLGKVSLRAHTDLRATLSLPVYAVPNPDLIGIDGYVGSTVILLPLRIDDDASAGHYTLSIIVTADICTDTECRPSVDVVATIDIVVT